MDRRGQLPSTYQSPNPSGDELSASGFTGFTADHAFRRSPTPGSVQQATEFAPHRSYQSTQFPLTYTPLQQSQYDIHGTDVSNLHTSTQRPIHVPSQAHSYAEFESSKAQNLSQSFITPHAYNEYSRSTPFSRYETSHASTMSQPRPSFPSGSYSHLRDPSSEFSVPQYAPISHVRTLFTPESQTEARDTFDTTTHSGITSPDLSSRAVSRSAARSHPRQGGILRSTSSLANSEKLTTEFETQLISVLEDVDAARLMNAKNKLLNVSRRSMTPQCLFDMFMVQDEVPPVDASRPTRNWIEGRKQLWRLFNSCWLALGQSTKTMILEEASLRASGKRSAETESHDQILGIEDISQLGNTLILLCDDLFGAGDRPSEYNLGVVDYESGILETRILDVLGECRQLLHDTEQHGIRKRGPGHRPTQKSP